jgi:hypothetical protein
MPHELKRIYFSNEMTTIEQMPESNWLKVAERIRRESNDLIQALYEWADGYQNDHNIRKIFGASDNFKRSIDSSIMFDTLDNDYCTFGERRAKKILEEISKDKPNEKIELWRNDISSRFLNNELQSPQDIINKLKTYLFEVHHPAPVSSVSIGESLGFSPTEML